MYEYYELKVYADPKGRQNRYNYYVGVRDAETKYPIYLTDYDKLADERFKDRYENSDRRCKVSSLVRFLNWMKSSSPSPYREEFIQKGPEAIDFDVAEIYLRQHADGLLSGMRNKPNASTQVYERYRMTCVLENIYAKYRKQEKKDHFFSISEKNGKYTKNRYELNLVLNEDKESILIRYLPLEVGAIWLKNLFFADRGVYLPALFQMIGGLRAAEACNIRSINSKYGPGYSEMRELNENKDEVITFLELNLMHEYRLRSDNKSCGLIKKARKQVIPAKWLSEHEELASVLDWQEREVQKGPAEEFGALFLNNSINNETGCRMALTPPNYKTRLKRVFEDYVIPEIMDSENDELKLWVNNLENKNWGPHWFRHYATVMYCMLPGVTSLEVMEFRGDQSEDSALAYLRHTDQFYKLYKEGVNRSLEILLNNICRTLRK